MHFRIQFLAAARLKTAIGFRAMAASNWHTRQKTRIMSFWNHIFIQLLFILLLVYNLLFLNQPRSNNFYTGRSWDSNIYQKHSEIHQICWSHQIYISRTNPCHWRLVREITQILFTHISFTHNKILSTFFDLRLFSELCLVQINVNFRIKWRWWWRSYSADAAGRFINGRIIEPSLPIWSDWNFQWSIFQYQKRVILNMYGK